MKVDAIASQEHYVDHLAPVWRALPIEHRGEFFIPRVPAAQAAARRATAIGLTTSVLPVEPRPNLTLVAGGVDCGRAHNRPVAYLNHGVGQTWRTPDGSLIPTGAGKPRPRVQLFLSPGPYCARIARELNPDARVVEVGSPKLDAWLGHQPVEPLVVVSTHWDHRVAPEARSALGHFLPALRGLAAATGVPVALHAHPRAASSVQAVAQHVGLEFIRTFDEVLERASVYAIDSSSTLFEFAATGRPVVALNAPTYRREHHHGLRFWEAASVAVNVGHPDQLVAAVIEAIEDAPEQREARAAALRLAYAPLDGLATQRAVTALLEHA